MAAIFALPEVLMTALKGFDFTGKPLWRLREGLDHVMVELTIKLRHTDDERPTARPTGPGRFESVANKRKKQQRQRSV